MKPFVAFVAVIIAPVVLGQQAAVSGVPCATGGSYAHDSAISPEATAVATSASYQHRAGHAGQLYDVTGLSVIATPAVVDEGGASQLDAVAQLDDTTVLALGPTEVTWSVESGPLISISTTGVATAGFVYQETGASVRATHRGWIGDGVLSVRNTDPDNFGLYAGDQLADDWQVQYFGVDNSAAAPARDPDGDGQDNLFEFTAGVSPVDPLERFRLLIRGIAGAPNNVALVFSPRFANRTYTVFYSTNLASGTWTPLPGTPPVSDNGLERTVTDTNVTGPRKFYRVQIDRP